MVLPRNLSKLWRAHNFTKDEPPRLSSKQSGKAPFFSCVSSASIILGTRIPHCDRGYSSAICLHILPVSIKKSCWRMVAARSRIRQIEFPMVHSKRGGPGLYFAFWGNPVSRSSFKWQTGCEVQFTTERHFRPSFPNHANSKVTLKVMVLDAFLWIFNWKNYVMFYGFNGGWPTLKQLHRLPYPRH